MRRSVLLTLSTLGLLVCLLGGTGLFAALTDTADVGPNHLDTAPLAGSADLKVALHAPNPNVPGEFACGTFEDNLVTAFIDAGNLMPGGGTSNQLCVQNIGSQTVGLFVTAIDLIDFDYACTGDEVEYGDLNCGPLAAPPTGELSSVIDVLFQTIDCTTGAPSGSPFGSNLFALIGNALVLTVSGLASNAVVCFDVRLIEPGGPTGYPVADLQKAQSDTVTWTFRFTGQAPT
jgi:hypothetical protein